MTILLINSIKYMSTLLLCVISLKYNRDTMLLDLESIDKVLYSKVLFRAILFKAFLMFERKFVYRFITIYSSNNLHNYY